MAVASDALKVILQIIEGSTNKSFKKHIMLKMRNFDCALSQRKCIYNKNYARTRVPCSTACSK